MTGAHSWLDKPGVVLIILLAGPASSSAPSVLKLPPSAPLPAVVPRTCGAHAPAPWPVALRTGNRPRNVPDPAPRTTIFSAGFIRPNDNRMPE